MPRRARFGFGRQHPEQLVGVDEAPLTKAHHVLLVWSQRPDRAIGRAPDPDSALAPRRIGQFDDAPSVAATRQPDLGEQLDLLQPESFDLGNEPAHDAAQVLGRQIEARPDVQQDPVRLEASVGCPLRLHPPDGPADLVDDPLDLGQAHQPPLVVSHRGEVADLGDGEQPLVVAVVAGRAVEQVDVLGRREMLQVEVVEPTELQAFGHHRMQAPSQVFGSVPLVADRAEGEMAHPAGAVVARRV